MLINSPIVAELLNGKARRGGISSKTRTSNRDKVENGRMRGPKKSIFFTNISFPISSHAYPFSHSLISTIV